MAADTTSYNFLDFGIKENATKVYQDTQRYDSKGALWFVVSVILVYGFAVVGVFVFNFYKGKKTGHDELDRQASSYIKNIDNIRKSFEQKERIHSANSYLKTMPQMAYSTKEETILQSGLKYMALPLFVTNECNENNNMKYDKYDSEEECSNNCESCELRTVTSNQSLHDLYTIEDILEELTDTETESDVFM